MGTCRLVIEVLKNGEYFMKGDGDDLEAHFKISKSNILRKAAVGGYIYRGTDKYTLRYNGETLPRRWPDNSKPKTKKPKISIAQVKAECKKTGLDYGYMVAKMEGRI